jgi:hypothetical protein
LARRRSLGEVKTCPALLVWPPEVLALQAELARAELTFARARTVVARDVARLLVARVAQELERAKRLEMAK